MNACFGRKTESEFPQASGSILLTEEAEGILKDGAFVPMSPYDHTSDRHNGGGNVSFLDTHVKWYRQSDLTFKRPQDTNHWYLFNPYRNQDGPISEAELHKVTTIGMCRYFVP